MVKMPLNFIRQANNCPMGMPIVFDVKMKDIHRLNLKLQMHCPTVLRDVQARTGVSPCSLLSLYLFGIVHAAVACAAINTATQPRTMSRA